VARSRTLLKFVLNPSRVSDSPAAR
jgi:hypothetical protein